MTAEPFTAPITRHILSERSSDGPQHCILCGATVSSHLLGDLPAGAVFEQCGRLFLIEPDGEAQSCLERLP